MSSGDKHFNEFTREVNTGGGAPAARAVNNALGNLNNGPNHRNRKTTEGDAVVREMAKDAASEGGKRAVKAGVGIYAGEAAGRVLEKALGDLEVAENLIELGKTGSEASNALRDGNPVGAWSLLKHQGAKTAGWVIGLGAASAVESFGGGPENPLADAGAVGAVIVGVVAPHVLESVVNKFERDDIYNQTDKDGNACTFDPHDLHWHRRDPDTQALDASDRARDRERLKDLIRPGYTSIMETPWKHHADGSWTRTTRIFGKGSTQPWRTLYETADPKQNPTRVEEEQNRQRRSHNLQEFYHTSARRADELDRQRNALIQNHNRTDATTSNFLSYKAYNRAVELALVHPHKLKDPYTQKTTQNDLDADDKRHHGLVSRYYTSDPWKRDPKDGVWRHRLNRIEISNLQPDVQLAVARLPEHAVEKADSRRAHELDLAAQQTIRENVAHSPHFTALNYWLGHEAADWGRAGRMPTAVTNELKKPDNILTASDGHTYTLGKDNKWTTPVGTVDHIVDRVMKTQEGDRLEANNNIRDELNQTRALRQKAEVSVKQAVAVLHEQHNAHHPAPPHNANHPASPHNAQGGHALVNAQLSAYTTREDVGSNHHHAARPAPKHPTPSLADPRHPAHAMFEQAQKGIDHLNTRMGLSQSPQERDRLAGALVVCALHHGMDRIDSVWLNHDHARLIAIAGDPKLPFHQREGIDISKNLNTPLEKTSSWAYPRAVRAEQKAQKEHQAVYNHPHTDPRHPDNRDHALYNQLHRIFPKADDNQLMQLTAACHKAFMTEQTIGDIKFNKETGDLLIMHQNFPTHTMVNIHHAPPIEQSIQQIQAYDQAVAPNAPAKQQAR